LEEAARNLGASWGQMFTRTILPLSMPGLLSGALLVFSVSMSAFVTPALMGGRRSRMIGQQIYEEVLSAYNWPGAASLTIVLAFFLSPLLDPHLLLGASEYLSLARLAWSTTSMPLLVGHTVIATPCGIRCVTAGLVGMDPRLEEAGMSLGASRLQAFFKVTLPLLRSSLVTAAVFSFIISFSDINLALFLAGASAPSLPVHIFSQIQFEADPSIAAASALQIVIVGGLILLAQRLFRLRLMVGAG